MAAVFTRCGFDAYDVHMTDILAGRVHLARFHGLVACGGFSYGDVLGAGEGWAKSILFNSRARDEFGAFFERNATFTLGVCNGCQMLAALKELIPGAQNWPRFVRNRSEQYEARLSLVQVPRSNSVLLSGMYGSVLPVVVSHGEGFAEFAGPAAAKLLEEARGLGLRTKQEVAESLASSRHDAARARVLAHSRRSSIRSRMVIESGTVCCAAATSESVVSAPSAPSRRASKAS